MEIFSRLLFGHLLADFTFQTNYLAQWKRRSLVGLTIHVLIHPICYFVLVFPYLSDVWVSFGGVALTGWVLIPLMTALHFVEDWARVTLVNRGWADNTLFYAWDQVVHIAILWLLTPTDSQPLETVWPILGSVSVMVTHCATVTIWFIEKDIFGREYPATEEKYITILQRLAVWLAFFMPHPWWMVIAIVVIALFMRHIASRRVDYSWTSVVLGNALAVACGLFTRFGLKSHF